MKYEKERIKEETRNYQSHNLESKNTISQIDAFLESHPEPLNDDYVITDTNPKDELGKQYAFLLLFDY